MIHRSSQSRFRNSLKVSLLLIGLCRSSASAFETYDLIESVLPKDALPRVLNSTDIELNPNDPQPLFSPMGDFNGDGVPDMAIVGIYGLPSKNPYFLLVGTQFQNPVRYQKLFFREYAQPVFLHKPGTTGEKDPGDQAFSITPCSQCTDGLDFYWDKKKKAFETRAWEKRFRRYQPIQPKPELETVPQETIDKALKIVGDLTDVKVFVAGLKKSKKQLGTRVLSATLSSDAPATEVRVQIFEKKKSGEKLYDEVTVDVESGAVLKRRVNVNKIR